MVLADTQGYSIGLYIGYEKVVKRHPYEGGRLEICCDDRVTSKIIQMAKEKNTKQLRLENLRNSVKSEMRSTSALSQNERLDAQEGVCFDKISENERLGTEKEHYGNQLRVSTVHTDR